MRGNKTPKFGISYSVFDGEELLEQSLKSVRQSADYINVVYQTVSWYGEPANKGLLSLLQDLVAKGLVDELVEYIPDLKLKASKNEIIKRNLGLTYAKCAKCDYFMTMDADEFYIHKEIEAAKAYILKNNISHAFCNIINYAYKPTQRLLKSTPSYVQIFSKIKRSSILKKNKKIITLIDPTRQLSHFFGAKYYFLPDIDMHHYTLVRRDFIKKIWNSSSNQNRKKPIKRKLDKSEYANVANIFNIEI